MDIQQIDTRIGTRSNYNFSHGNTLPLTGAPFGMNYLSVQTTDEKTSWWFNPDAHTFKGFRLTHQPSPWIGDFQHLLFSFKTRNLANYEQIDDYNNNQSIFRPDLMMIDILTQEVRVMATANTTGGAFKFFNYSDRDLYLMIADEKVKLVEQNKNRFVFELNNFVACEDPNFKMWVAIKNRNLKVVNENHQDNYYSYLISLDDTDELIFSTSFISMKQAKFNLESEDDFSTIQQTTVAKWNHYFNKIQVEDHKKEQVQTFYENLYRCFLYPMQFYEIDQDGKPIHYSTALNKAVPGKMFTNIGFWDVYRSSFPLYSLICPKKFRDFLEGFFDNYQETGFLPRWLSPDERGMMPGTMLDVIIADAAVKGIIPSDVQEKYLYAMIKAAETSSANKKYGREGLEDYNSLGYVPNSHPESVNKTLSYSYSDWAISVVAKLLKKDQVVEKFSRRALNYRNLFDKKVGLMMPKDENGKFIDDFDDLDWGCGYTEGSAWQNSFNVYQDIPGLIKLYGSKETFIKKLKELANKSPIYNVGSYGQVIHEMREMSVQPFGQIAISNQPSFHLPYLFALAGDSHDAEILINQLRSAFNSSVDGFPGDEDNGSMSAWYVWSALGLYPEAAGKGSYIFGSPLFDYVTIKLENGRNLSLVSYQNARARQFVSERTFNGEKCGPTISHSELLKGGTITARLSLLAE